MKIKKPVLRVVLILSSLLMGLVGCVTMDEQTRTDVSKQKYWYMYDSSPTWGGGGS
jgi:hypothetical protein